MDKAGRMVLRGKCAVRIENEHLFDKRGAQVEETCLGR